MAKPIKTLELHYPIIQFLIITIMPGVTNDGWPVRKRKPKKLD